MTDAIPYTLTKDSIVVNYKGETYTKRRGEPNFLDARQACLDEAWEELIDLMGGAPKIVKDWSDYGFAYKSGQLSYQGCPVPITLFKDMEQALKLQRNDFGALSEFAKSLLTNPSWRSVQQTWAFLKGQGIGILPDGRIMAFKSVRRDLFDHHSGTICYEVGHTISMPRNQISDDPSLACHVGLHAGSYGYAKEFCRGSQPVILVVSFWPKDVVCVPHDAGSGKVRVCELFVEGLWPAGLTPSSDIVVPAEERAALLADVESLGEPQCSTSDSRESEETFDEEEEDEEWEDEDSEESYVEPARVDRYAYAVVVPVKLEAPEASRAPEKPKAPMSAQEARTLEQLRAYAKTLGIKNVKAVPGGKVGLLSRIREAEQTGTTSVPEFSRPEVKQIKKSSARQSERADLEKMTLKEMRAYAASIRLVGASKVPGGKEGLIAAILSVSK